MNKITRYILLLILPALGLANGASAQGMHFSQYYNAPLLLNPANAALMSDNDYRVGINYRKQWASVPVPYTTISAYGDCQFMRNSNYSNWLGLGFAFFNDKAGNGDLSLTKFNIALAYHVMMGDYSMLSAGLEGGYGQRSINFNKLSFNQQWDGFRFDTDLANGEHDGIINTSYLDVGAGINYAYFPNEATYIKIGAGLAHVNQPKESFYTGKTANKMGMRPTGNIDALLQLTDRFTLNPSIYYSTQKSASDLIFGGQGLVNVSSKGYGREDGGTTKVILGAYYRWNEAVIGTFGMNFSGVKFMVSYDYTISTLAVDNGNKGGLELSFVYQGMYGDMGGSRRTINCPRF
ncbi:MAG: type IX secretion system membrane protein PorP/SprF [Sphingobacteriales bacterium]|nr:MAG: type IX secretion system membrane protein PorP/SprF [Sphingobacteriales bacterium]